MYATAPAPNQPVGFRWPIARARGGALPAGAVASKRTPPHIACEVCGEVQHDGHPPRDTPPVGVVGYRGRFKRVSCAPPDCVQPYVDRVLNLIPAERPAAHAAPAPARPVESVGYAGRLFSCTGPSCAAPVAERAPEPAAALSTDKAPVSAPVVSERVVAVAAPAAKPVVAPAAVAAMVAVPAVMAATVMTVSPTKPAKPVVATPAAPEPAPVPAPVVAAPSASPSKPVAASSTPPSVTSSAPVTAHAAKKPLAAPAAVSDSVPAADRSPEQAVASGAPRHCKHCGAELRRPMGPPAVGYTGRFVCIGIVCVPATQRE